MSIDDELVTSRFGVSRAETKTPRFTNSLYGINSTQPLARIQWSDWKLLGQVTSMILSKRHTGVPFRCGFDRLFCSGVIVTRQSYKNTKSAILIFSGNFWLLDILGIFHSNGKRPWDSLISGKAVVMYTTSEAVKMVKQWSIIIIELEMHL